MRQRARKGYVLLMTLLLLMLAASAMVGISRRSLIRAVEAKRAQEELQRRWGVLSIRTGMLPEAERILAAAEKRAGARGQTAAAQVTLGGHAFELRFADEQAKVNVNALYERWGAAGAERVVRELVYSSGSSVAVRLLPWPAKMGEADGGRETHDPFGSLAQVFPEAPAWELVGRGGRRSPIGELTCWGDGKLNFQRASPEAIAQVCQRLLDGGHARRLVAMRDEGDGVGLAEALGRLQLPRGRVEEVRELLSEGSRCHSLWIVSRSADRRWYHLSVAASGAAGLSSFDW